MNEQEVLELLRLLSQGLKYTPIVYRQSLYATDQNAFGNDYVLEFKQTEIPEDSLLFFVPAYSSNDSGACTLTIRFPKTNANGELRYVEKKYDIIVEQNEDVTRRAGKGDIRANRMCIFRFKSATKQLILCNSPLYNDADYNNLKVTNGKFRNVPVVLDPLNPNKEYRLITEQEYNSLLRRVEIVESRIIFGTDDPEEALKDSPAGTIYIQHEGD